MGLSVSIADRWIQPMEERIWGVDGARWRRSKEYDELISYAQSLSPGKKIYDKRTRAYKYLKWHEPRAMRKFLDTSDRPITDAGRSVLSIIFKKH